MRNLLLLRGAPGCGKSTFVKKWNLTPYTICVDDIRSLLYSPSMDHENGKIIITQKYDNNVWNLIFNILEKRAQVGDFCIIDATHCKTQDFNKYNDIVKKYHYRITCIDFSSVDINLCKYQNAMRNNESKVDDQVIDNIYSRFDTQKIPSKIDVIKYNDEESIKKFLYLKPLGVNQYNKIVFIGDIHGCYNPLEKYFNENPISDDNLYVFLGDYFDRGIQNDKVCEFILKIYNKSNVMLLQGNHEKWLIAYANNEYQQNTCKSSEFMNNTVPQLDKFDKKELRQLCRKLIQCAYLKYRDNKFICTHAGLGFMPENLKFISSETMIKGGRYEEKTDEWFEKNNTDVNLYQVHGHRNLYEIDINEFKHSFNLNEYVEFGDNLRILEIEK